MSTYSFGVIGDSDPVALVSAVDELARRAQAENNYFRAGLDESLTLYLYGHNNETDIAKGTILVENQTRPNIQSIKNNLLKDPPEIEIVPLERAGLTTVFLGGQQFTGTPKYIEGVLGAYRTSAGPVTVVNDGQQMVIQPGLEPLVVDDAFAARAVKQMLDVLLNECHWQAMLDRAVRDALCLGWSACLLTEGDRGWQLVSIPHKNIQFDTREETIREGNFLVFDQVFDVDAALANYPQWREEILRQRTVGDPQQGIHLASKYRGQDARAKPQVLIRWCWINNQQVRMSTDELLAKGILTRTTTPETPLNEGGVVPGRDEWQNQQGEVVDPDGDVYHRRAWRQIAIVGNELVEDAECAFPTPPIVLFKNNEIPGRLHALSEPHNYAGLQGALNQALTSIVRNGQDNSAQSYLAPNELREAFGAQVEADGKVQPGRIYFAARETLAQLGPQAVAPLKQMQNIPALSEAYGVLANALKTASMMPDVMRGEARAGWAAQTVGMLQNAAASPIMEKSKMIQLAVQDMARLGLHVVLNLRAEADWLKLFSTWTPAVVAEVKKRMQDVNYQIDVKITAALEMQRDQERQRDMVEVQSGLMSRLAYLRKWSEDGEAEARRLGLVDQQGNEVAPVAAMPQMPPGAAVAG